MNTSNGLAGRVAAVVSKSARSIGAVIADAVYALRIAAGRRTYRPWRALIVVPLAMMASALTVSGVAWPAALWLSLLVCAWWWYPGWRWGWVAPSRRVRSSTWSVGTCRRRASGGSYRGG